MIEGIRIDVPGAEVKDLLVKKSLHHLGRIESYQAELARQESIAAERDKANNRGSSREYDPITEAREKIEEHRNAATLAEFLASHVVVNETYRISEPDLVKLGIRGAKQF